MEKKKEIANREENRKEQANAKAKKIEDSKKKKRQERKGNQPCRTHNGARLWKGCPTNPKNQG